MQELRKQGDVGVGQAQGRRLTRTPFFLLTIGLLLALVLGACGRRDDSPSPPPAGGAAPREVPTMPAARFAQPTTMIGSGAAQPAAAEPADDAEANGEDAEPATPEPEEEAASEATPAPPTVDLERGANIYQVRGCHECHGAQAEGIPGEGSALAGLTLSESEFTTILRTGGSGRLGSGHLYGPSAISPGGMSALYAWLESLD